MVNIECTLVGERPVGWSLMVIIYTVMMCASLLLQSRTDQSLVPLDGGQQVVHRQMFVVGVGDEDGAGAVEVPLMVAFEVRYVLLACQSVSSIDVGEYSYGAVIYHDFFEAWRCELR